MLHMHRILRAHQLPRPNIIHDAYLLLREILLHFLEYRFRVRSFIGWDIGAAGVVVDGTLNLL